MLRFLQRMTMMKKRGLEAKYVGFLLAVLQRADIDRPKAAIGPANSRGELPRLAVRDGKTRHQGLQAGFRFWLA